MSTDPRSTQFRQFAALMAKRASELPDVYIEISDFGNGHEQWERFLAECAYDLVSHTMLHVNPYHLDALSFEECVSRIPDMTAWPEQEKGKTEEELA